MKKSRNICLICLAVSDVSMVDFGVYWILMIKNLICNKMDGIMIWAELFDILA